MARIGLLLTSLLLLMGGVVAMAAAQTVPTKTITFYNNSADRTLYPVIQAPIMNGADVRDLWLQAQFQVTNVSTQIFNTTLLYKIYVNRNGGVPPKSSVTLTVPFYTQLLPTSPANLGKVNDQFIDWWNAMRVYVFDGKDAADAAYNYSVDRTGKIVPPIPVQPVSGAALPTCTSSTTSCEPLLIRAYVNGFPPSVPAQLIEYTFAAAQGPPLASSLSIDRSIVNFNISAVDQIYLPAAIGAHGNATPQNTYLGSTQAVTPFRSALAAFTANGTLWPLYVPAYYSAKNPTIPLPTPPAGGQPYPQPQLPSTDTVYAESFRNPPPAPPVLSSDTLSGIGVLGQVAQGTLDLWTKCTSTTPTQSPTCTKIQQVNNFFAASFHQCFPGQALPATPDFLQAVYGWVQFPNCSTPLVKIAGYDAAIRTYCDLQYNFFDPTVLPAGRLQSLCQADPPDPGLERLRVLDRRCRGVQEPAGRRGHHHHRRGQWAGEPDPDAIADRIDLPQLLRGQCRRRRAARQRPDEAPAALVPDLRPAQRQAGLGYRQGPLGVRPMGDGAVREPGHRRGGYPQRPAEHRPDQAARGHLTGER